MKNKTVTDQELLQEAYKICRHAYAPFSHFKVGAALITDTGELFTGVNVESASYGATICAERTAIVKAVSERNARPWNYIVRIAIVSEKGGKTFPCGICRQLLLEFSHDDLNETWIIVDDNGQPERHTVAELIPLAFRSPELVTLAYKENI